MIPDFKVLRWEYLEFSAHRASRREQSFPACGTGSGGGPGSGPKEEGYITDEDTLWQEHPLAEHARALAAEAAAEFRAQRVGQQQARVEREVVHPPGVPEAETGGLLCWPRAGLTSAGRFSPAVSGGGPGSSSEGTLRRSKAGLTSEGRFSPAGSGGGPGSSSCGDGSDAQLKKIRKKTVLLKF